MVTTGLIAQKEMLGKKSKKYEKRAGG